MSLIEQKFTLQIYYSCDDEDILEKELETDDFTEPTSEAVEDINTIQQLLDFLSETFGNSIYDLLGQLIIDEIESCDLQDISNIIICCHDEEITYVIDLSKKTVDIENS